jgi:hypothetical protein
MSKRRNVGRKRSKSFYRDSRGRTRPITPRVTTVVIAIPGHEAERRRKEWETEGHWIERDGEKIWIPEHEDRAHESRYHVSAHKIRRPEIKYAGGFDALARKIAEEYRKKGYSKERSEEIGKDTAADIYRSKLARDYGRR